MSYYAILRYHATGHAARLDFPSPFLRALHIIAVSAYVDVLEEGETA